MSEMETISCTDIDPVTFYARYVSTRKPVKFSDHFRGPEWNFHKWSNEYLKEKVGSARVKIECRDNSTGRYGKGNETTLEFRDFLDHLEAGNETLYMTTQKLEYSAEGQPHILSEPVKGLQEDIPLRPPLLGHLIPQNINMWMGCTTQCSSSGLHHDFHDNIYIVLRGSKQIHLFPPQEHPNMYLVGSVTKLHANGRFNYDNRLTRPDGSAVGATEALLAAQRLEEAAARLDGVVS